MAETTRTQQGRAHKVLSLNMFKPFSDMKQFTVVQHTFHICHNLLKYLLNHQVDAFFGADRDFEVLAQSVGAPSGRRGTRVTRGFKRLG